MTLEWTLRQSHRFSQAQRRFLLIRWRVTRLSHRQIGGRFVHLFVAAVSVSRWDLVARLDSSRRTLRGLGFLSKSPWFIVMFITPNSACCVSVVSRPSRQGRGFRRLQPLSLYGRRPGVLGCSKRRFIRQQAHRGCRLGRMGRWSGMPMCVRYCTRLLYARFFTRLRKCQDQTGFRRCRMLSPKLKDARCFTRLNVCEKFYSTNVCGMLSPTERCKILRSISVKVRMEPLTVRDVSRLHGTVAERVSGIDGRQRVVASSLSTH